MDPVVNVNASGDLPEPRPVERPVANAVRETVPSSGRFFLFKYVTTLVTGLILLTLVSMIGYMLLDYWMNKPDVSYFTTFIYSFNLYLLVALVLTAGLHIWMRLKIRSSEDHSSAGAFQAIFLAILALTIISALGAIVYIATDAAMGTANYTSSDVWTTVLGSVLTIVWSVLLWWHFKKDSLTQSALYTGVVGIVTLVVAVLLVVFPVAGQRDHVIDSRTASDLQTISIAVGDYVTKNNKLPGALNEPTIEDARVKGRLASYEYSVTAVEAQEKPQSNSFFSEDFFNSRSSGKALGYKLCATFKTDTSQKEVVQGIPFLTSASQMSTHPKGKHCFDLTAYGKEEAAEDSEATREQEGMPTEEELMQFQLQ